MQKTYVVLLVVAGLLAAGITFAQGDSDYPTWMKTAAATVGSLTKGIAAKDGAAVGSDATKLEATFKQVGAFWQKKGGAADAVDFAMKAQMASAAVSKAAAAGNMDQASAELKNVQATCGGCHMAHRERTPEGAFKMK